MKWASHSFKFNHRSSPIRLVLSVLDIHPSYHPEELLNFSSVHSASPPKSNWWRQDGNGWFPSPFILPLVGVLFRVARGYSPVCYGWWWRRGAPRTRRRTSQTNQRPTDTHLRREERARYTGTLQQLMPCWWFCCCGLRGAAWFTFKCISGGYVVRGGERAFFSNDKWKWLKRRGEEEFILWRAVSPSSISLSPCGV